MTVPPLVSPAFPEVKNASCAGIFRNRVCLESCTVKSGGSCGTVSRFPGRLLMRLRLLVVVVIAAFSGSATLHGQTPAAVEWTAFLSMHNGRSDIPEDTRMGPLPNMRRPDPAWASAIEICNLALDLLGRGEVPRKYLHPSVRTLIGLEMSEALNSIIIPISARYGLPSRSGSRLTVPVRLSSGNLVSYGYLYLIYDDEWFIEQWAVDLTFSSDTGED